MRNETSNPPIPGKKTDKPERARMSEGGANAPPSEADLARSLQLAAHEALGGGGDAGEHLERLHRMQLAHSERTAGVERKYEAASLELERALAENEGLRGDVSRLSHDLMASKEHTRMSLTSALEPLSTASAPCSTLVSPPPPSPPSPPPPPSPAPPPDMPAVFRPPTNDARAGRPSP